MNTNVTLQINGLGAIASGSVVSVVREERRKERRERSGEARL